MMHEKICTTNCISVANPLFCFIYSHSVFHANVNSNKIVYNFHIKYLKIPIIAHANQMKVIISYAHHSFVT
jgi:hypothetical protein